MKQVLLKKGTIYTTDVPKPQVDKGMVLVKVEYSCISAGTEMSGVKQSSENIVQKAIHQPEKISKGINMIKERGIKETLDKISGKYTLGDAMGYSASGIVVESGSDEFQKGDRVACMGAGYANHAGYICVPHNLVAKVPENVSMESASTAALGCIAMQGVRRAEIELGDYIVICGAGILGQLASRFAIASGATVIITDVDERRLDIARNSGVKYALNVSNVDAVTEVMNITGKNGADKVILTAATDSNELISQAFQMCRRRGTVVLVGVAGMNLKREDMYKKELNFKIATSYGPGRYDSAYEENGIDYPYGFVRYTEKRNLEAYLRLLSNRVVDTDDIIEKIVLVDLANEGYEALKQSANKPLIVLIKYSDENEEDVSKDIVNDYIAPRGVIKVALCGAGGFAKGMHLPNMQKMPDKYKLYAVQSRTSSNAKAIALQYGAKYSTTDYDEILKDPDVDLVMICTRHNLHAEMAIKALEAGKAVFVEKPMGLNADEADRVLDTVRKTGMPYMVGFNRRFSDYAVEIKKNIKERINPIIVNYRMNAGYIPIDHWTQGPEGGGRIIGEGCHIFDLFAYFTDAHVESVSKNAISPNTSGVIGEDNCIITVKYNDGSVCNLVYTGLGHKDLSKEYCEVFCDGKVYVIDDYKKLYSYGVNTKKIESASSEKGQYQELIAFYNAIKDNSKYPIDISQLEETTKITFLN